MDKYENHIEEWKEEENERKRMNKYHSYVDPRNPDYISPEQECGRCGKTNENEVCEDCMNIMLLGAPEQRFEPDENFYKEIGAKKDA